VSIDTGSKAVNETSMETVAHAVADLPEPSGYSAEEVTDLQVTSQVPQSNELIYSPLVETALKSSSKPEVAYEPVTSSFFYGHKQKSTHAVDKGHPDDTLPCSGAAHIGSRSKHSHHLPSHLCE